MLLAPFGALNKAPGVVAGVVLFALLSCSSSSSKHAPGAGGDGNDHGGTGNTGAAGEPDVGQPGDYGSIWRRETAEILSIDSANPTPASVDIQFEEKVTDAQYETDVEVFEQIVDDELVVYAHYDDSEVYFRLRLPMTALDDGYYRTSRDGSTANYSLEDGNLKMMQTQGSGTLAVISTTYYVEYTDEFPPPDWPSAVVDVAPVEAP